VVGGVLALSMRLAPRFGVKGDAAFSAGGGLVRRTISNTNFVTVWVIFAYLVFELSVYFLGLDLKAVFDGWALFPAIAIAPKVAIVATLYSAVPAIILAYGWMFWME
jgi:hypothetical protein